MTFSKWTRDLLQWNHFISWSNECRASPSEVCSIHSAGNEKRLHTEMPSWHSYTSRGGHGHTAQCPAVGWLQLQVRWEQSKLMHFLTVIKQVKHEQTRNVDFTIWHNGHRKKDFQYHIVVLAGPVSIGLSFYWLLDDLCQKKKHPFFRFKSRLTGSKHCSSTPVLIHLIKINLN